MNRKLYRSTRDRKVCGLLGGLGEWLGFDVTLLRVLFVIGVFFSAFTLIAVYFVVSLVVPKEPYQPFGPTGYGAGPYGGGYQGQQGYQGGYSNDPNYYNGPRAAGPTNPYGSSTYGGVKQTNSYDANYASSNDSSIDSMMMDIEKKALKKEIEELRQKVAKYERGDK
ncbi:phage-shock protein [Paenibacillus sp. E194]|jgi:phage shock protein C|uniref:PspC domain-containing protein n=3 Tax=Paenibacillus TaxID=44249 RepID=A0A383R6L4_PAEAL|nr:MULTISPECIES: PspC domain-containing protein [Paenibacillus]EPY08401.1 phage shock protein PspC [Paenibacillus alvei TS-15]KJB85179.1 phage-shock protein [Paenibacillus sp. E194]MCM3291841.1 PspC domain-containing protein [Paenibacillus sp. MER 180]MCY9533004.1 PspC domain-containing protein [Paenibacillus alvei]MDT8979474.1 PspC domain-containing protein [Paenibacillus sp. chi10]